jgi:hypothetical protein
MIIKDPASFRDPSGFIFHQEGKIYRQINEIYRNQYRHLMNSGLYNELVNERLLIPHKEISLESSQADALIIQPKRIPFISYPYEWCFSEFKDAALATLNIHQIALKYGMILKDASAYNIQFLTGYPVLIDSLSFDFYEEGSPWVAYGQFCRHFIDPLLLMCYVDPRMSKISQLFIDGVPLDLATSLLKNRGGFFSKLHIKYHAKLIAKHDKDGRNEQSNLKKPVLSKKAFNTLTQGLINGIIKLNPKENATEWGEYYSISNYNEAAVKGKEYIVSKFLDKCGTISNVWDFGANDGTFSKIAISKGMNVIAFDSDTRAIEKNYSEVKQNHSKMLPLLFDLTSQSPSLGFANAERLAISERQHPDCIMMLAVIHHLVISNNLPFDLIVNWLAYLCDYLIIEFVPKEDSQVQILLSTRNDIFVDYTQSRFEMAFNAQFKLLEKEFIPDSARSIYLFKKYR